MSLQEQSFKSSQMHVRMTAPVALLIGAVFAALLVWAVQGTDVAGDGPVWYGNSGPVAAQTSL